MLLRKKQLETMYEQQTANKIMLRTFGYGVPNVEKARYSADNILTLVSQNRIQPFNKLEEGSASEDAKLNQMHLYNLPWPQGVLDTLPVNMVVKLRVTLSYFIEANPSRRGYRDRFNYQSHGLRFDVKRPAQSLDNFKALVNKLSVTEDYLGPEGDSGGWLLGSQLRTRGSVHSDIWTGPAAQLADMNAIAIFPVGGWWKSRSSERRWSKSTDYSLIVTIEVPDETIDIYTGIETIIQNEINIEINV